MANEDLDPIYVLDLEELAQKVRDTDKYYLALGRFIHTFSQAESSIKSYLSRLIGIDAHTANAVFSGMRMRPTMDGIRRVYERNKQSPPPIYSAVTDQLGQILSARDSIVHSGATLYAQPKPVVTNARYAHTEEAVREFPISPSLLDDMTSDLEVIDYRIRLAEIQMWMEEDVFKNAYGDPEPPTWRYKHAPQPRRRAKKQTKDQIP